MVICPPEAKYLLRRLGQEPTPEANRYGVGSGPSLQLREQVADVALDRLLREVETVADLAVRKPFRDELKDLDLARGRKVLGLGARRARGEIDQVDDRGAARGYRLEAARVLAIPGQDLLALSCVHVAAIGAPAWLL